MKYEILPIDRYLNAGPQYSVRLTDAVPIVEIRNTIHEFLNKTFENDFGWRGKWKGPDEYFPTPQLAIWFLESGMIDSRSLNTLIDATQLTSLDWTILFNADIEDISGFVYQKDVIVFCDTKSARKLIKSKGTGWIHQPLQVPSFFDNIVDGRWVDK